MTELYIKSIVAVWFQQFRKKKRLQLFGLAFSFGFWGIMKV